MTRVRFEIEGMDCSDEAILLRKILGELKGVSDVAPNVLDRSVAVEFRETEIQPAEMMRAIERTGMRATTRDPEGSPATVTRDDAKSAKHRAALAGAGAGFLLLAFIIHAGVAGWREALMGGEGATAPLVARVLYVAAITCGGWFVLPRAYAGIRSLRADMYVLMTVAVVGAVAIGEWLEGATVTVLFSTSLALEAWTVGRARNAIGALAVLAPQRARVLRKDEQDEFIAVESVAIGERVLVKTGEQIPLDGRIISGESTVNEAPITGESIPVAKAPGDVVLAGTLNHEGVLEVQVEKLAGDSTLARVAKLVAEAQAKRSPSERWVEKFASVYTPVVLVLALLVATVPPLIVGDFRRWLYEALSLLVIACPCALVISTPVSMVAALVAAAKHGVLVKGAEFLELLAGVRAMAFDKTGTLTVGKPQVEEVSPLAGHSQSEVLEIALAIERRSEHPLAQAIVRHAEELGVRASPVDDYVAVGGKGATAKRAGLPVWVGSAKFAREMTGDEPERDRLVADRSSKGGSVVLVGEKNHTCGFILLRDKLRPETARAIRELRESGVQRLIMLTGDNTATAKAIGAESGLDEVRAELLPADKVKQIEGMVAEFGSVVMVGDGVNDAPALARATVGIAMGVGGSASALETADVALMKDDLSKLPWLISHARRTLRVVRQNITAALIVKAAFVVLALTNHATLWAAIAADMGVSLAVVFNALRLLGPVRT